ncbi:hypothetical protein PRIPAC_84502, partial [Pristionchus pacificus]
LSQMRSILLLVLLFLIIDAGNLNVRVRGRTSCQTTENGLVSSKKVPGVKVELWERDNGENALVDADDLIDTQIVKEKGGFLVYGGQPETFNQQEFYVKIHFPCVANSTCNFVKYKKFCEKNPGGFYMAKKQDIPQEYRFVQANITFKIEYKMGYAHHEIDSNIPYL